jgi:asparagine synthase (glutamine-hydrolysing)
LGAIAGISGKTGDDLDALMELMLDSMRHRGAFHEKASLREDDHNSIIGVATHTSDSHKVAQSAATAVVFDGSFYEHPDYQAADFIHERIATSSSKPTAMKQTLVEIGGFACIVACKKQVYAFRDVNGLKPLYYGRVKDLTAFSSERKALWRIGSREVQRVAPGYLYTLTSSGMRKRRVVEFKRPAERKVSLNEASATLQHLLKRSIQRITKKVGRVAVAFSGGLDSALTAILAKKAGAEVEPVSVGLQGSPELSTVEHFAKRLDLPITLETFQPDSLEEYVRRVLWLIEEPNLMKVSVAVPLHWAALVASRRGCNVMLCGQGSDELYGGYAKYTRTLGTKGRGSLVRELYRSVIESSKINYERDDQACAPFGIELRTPFADPDVIRFSLTVPTQFKVKDESDVTRKWVLRDVAKHEGLPDEVVWRRKKAIQHGTAVENTIRSLAKRQGLPVDLYLSKLYEEVIGFESMP